MTLINPSVKLNYLPIDSTWAKLERLDGKGAYDFLVNPKVQRQYEASFNELTVIGSGQPQLKYIGSKTKLTLPEVLFWTDNNAGDISDILSTLATMTKPLVREAPLLKLTWGFTVYPRLYLESFPITETQMRSGKVTAATGSMSFLIVPDPVITQTTDATKTKLSAKERQEYQLSVSDLLSKDRALGVKLGVSKGSKIEVQADGKVVSISPQKTFSSIGSLKSILGKVKPIHENL